MEKLINEIKNDFESEIAANDKRVVKLNKLKGELFAHTNQQSLFDQTKTEKTNWNKKVKKYTSDIQKLETQLEEIRTNKIYEYAFEWRFEFPEVLNDAGDFVGFDAVIGNPPYVQLQSIKEISNQLKGLDFETYASMGDLYALFYERGNDILQQKGILCFITGSAWMRTNYGQTLRTYFNKKTSLLEVIDLSDCDIFDSATVLTSIVSFIKEERKEPIKAIRFTRKDQHKLLNLAKEFEQNHTPIEMFPESSWIILDRKSNAIKEKVEVKGKQLREWDISINYGIKTGFNDAYVIDKEIKEKLIEEDSVSSELIKPLLRGRDVKKYLCDYGDLWLLNVHNGVKEKDIPPVDINKYPAIKNHLDKFITKLTNRADKGISPYHLRNCVYLEDFEHEKIVYPNMTKFLPFTLDLDGNYLNDKCFILSGEKLYYLVAFLNSKLFRFCFSDAFPELQGNSKEIKKFILEKIPVIEISDEEPFRNKVIEIIDKKKGSVNSDTTDLESEIDQMIYKLYDLSEEEIKIVEGEN